MNVVIREPRLLDKLSSKVRLKGYSRSTEKNYSYWVKRYILFHHKVHPAEMGIKEVESFLTSIAVQKSASAATQNQALSALLFLYKHVLDQPIDLPVKALRAKKYDYIPTVLAVDEVQRLFACLSGTLRLMAELTYGAGMRVSETLNLRVQDIDFSSKRILVRDGKGRKDRLTILPDRLVAPLQRHLVKVKELHVKDLASGYGAVSCRGHTPNECRMRARNSFGSSSFLQMHFSMTRALVSVAAGMFTRARFKRLSSAPRRLLIYASGCRSMHSGTASPRTCCKAVAMFVASRPF